MEQNFHLSNKKALFYNLKYYSTYTNNKVFDYIPVTFHIENNLQDKERYESLSEYEVFKTEQCKVFFVEDILSQCTVLK